MKNIISILMLTSIFFSCVNKETTENKHSTSENKNNYNILTVDNINNNEPISRLLDDEEFILSIKEAILYNNRDTLTVYKNNQKNSESFIINNENVFLTKIDETPGWFYLKSTRNEVEGYVYIYDISEKSFYGDLEQNEKSGNYYRYQINAEYKINKQNENINRYGPLLIINHNGKITEFLDTFNTYKDIFGEKFLIINYYPENNELLILETYWQGASMFIYNLEHNEYRCKNIDIPYYNNTRTYMVTFSFNEDFGLFKSMSIKLFIIRNGFYEEIYNEFITIDKKWLYKGIFWINNNEVHIDYGESGKIIFKIGNELNIINTLVPLFPE